MIKNDILWLIGGNCQNFRLRNHYTQVGASKEIGCSVENVSGFENGRNDNMLILLWYVSKGMTIQEILKGVNLYGIKD